MHAAKDMHLNSPKQSYTSLSERLMQLSGEKSECSIDKVYTHLRNLNPKAYETEVIAIGPYHREKEQLRMMEHHKLRYLKSLLQRKDANAETYVNTIKEVESKARKCYAVQVNLSDLEFIDMLVLDGCFIIELVLKSHDGNWIDEDDPIFQMNWIRSCLIRDLMLFENQIPFFVLCRLFDLIEAPNQHLRLTYLLIEFFKILHRGKVKTAFDNEDTKHLLSLIHQNWTACHNTNPYGNIGEVDEADERGNGWSPVARYRSGLFESRGGGVAGGERGKKKGVRFIDTASKLREDNVVFKRDENLTLFDIKFTNGVMRMAPLTVEDRTEAFFRNLIAYEQYFHCEKPTVVTDYVMFMDCLINSSKDVEILKSCNIINNQLGDDELVSKMVNSLTLSVTGGGDQFQYSEICNNVNQHCKSRWKSRWNRWMAMLRQKYFNSPWAVLSFTAAVILLLLTFIQTVFTVHPF